MRFHFSLVFKRSLRRQCLFGDLQLPLRPAKKKKITSEGELGKYLLKILRFLVRKIPQVNDDHST